MAYASYGFIIMLEQVSNFDQDIEFIVGFAGSGKSTLLAERATLSTLVLTPTHKAASVLMAKGVKNVVTIHSALKLVPTLNQNFRKGQKMQKLQRIGGVDLSSIKYVFIDEYSMINQSILDMLLEVLPSEASVTVFGDAYQLPPVDGEPIEPEIYTDRITYLDKQYRAEAPEVVETFMRFMNYIKDGKEMDLKLHKDIQHGTLHDFDPETDRALAYTNKHVLSLNSQIAKILNLPEVFESGEALFANSMDVTYESDGINPSASTIYPACMSKGKLMDDDALQIAICKIENDIEKFGTDISEYKLAVVNVDGKNYNIHYDNDHYHNAKILRSNVERAQFHVIKANNLDEDVNLPSWCKENRTAEGVRERGWAWAAFIAHGNLVFNLQRPYATTIHKSQGSEFHTVYIAQSDIKKAIMKGYYVNYARLMYVALSRAIHRVVIV